ncbi:hypothetical protein BX600DRAFT_247706 [Xylariales sp. PMI_506]|nr:hypothetical protein BX600DRAFT_247706 [Xylariales sp. PMI_506]
MVMADLDVADVVALRQCCRMYRELFDADFFRKQFIKDDRADPTLQECCAICLAIPRDRRIVKNKGRLDDPWQSECFHCWRMKGGLIEYERRFDKYFTGVDGISGIIVVCELRGWPHHVTSYVTRKPLPTNMHPKCQRRRRIIFLMWFGLGLAQWILGIMAGVCAWISYQSNLGIVVPISINFGLMWLSLCMVCALLSSTKLNSYVPSLCVEIVMTAIWLLPIIINAKDMSTLLETLNGWFPILSLVVFIACFVFRLLNTAGYIILWRGYDPRNVFLPDLPRRKKRLFTYLTLIAWWAYVP